VIGRILVGISNWTYLGLQESGFYPPQVKTPAQRLAYYASQFPVAEIDSTYHFFARQINLAMWLGNTSQDFTFDVRAFSLFTGHPTPFASLPRSLREKFAGVLPDKPSLYPHDVPDEVFDDLWDGFRRTVEAFKAAGRLGTVFFQFPTWFHPGEKSLQNIAGCRERLAGYPMSVEFRVPNWLTERKEETLAFLRAHDIGLVCVDEPQGLKSSVPPEVAVTAPLAVVRFHGRNETHWDTRGMTTGERFDYLYTEDELREWVPRIKQLAAAAETVHIIFKNKQNDYPVRNARQMTELLGLA
jgi:uncharacterized protein YecE (DUF72 family)